MVASLDTTPLERERALAAYNHSTAAREESIEALAEGIAKAKAEAERSSTEEPAEGPPDSSTQEPASSATRGDSPYEHVSDEPGIHSDDDPELPLPPPEEGLRNADFPIEDIDFDDTEDAEAAVSVGAYADNRISASTHTDPPEPADDSRGGRTTTFGYSASDISRSARAWWPAGFAETESLESFTAILDEMVEMGVLARKNDHYALRSQRIAAMLGSRGEIGNRLQNLIELAPRRRPDPMLSHRRLASGWSPLTLRQEAALHSMLKAPGGPRIILISAAEASGLGKLRDALNALLSGPAVNWRTPRQLLSSNPRHIIDAATILRSDATQDAPGVVLVEGKWPDVETLRGLRKHPALRESLRPVRLVLCGEPKTSVLNALGDMPDIVHVQVAPLPVEAMLHWMNREQIGFADNEPAQFRLREASGGYLNVLEAAQIDGPAKRMPDLLVAAVEAAAAKVGPSQIGLDVELETFARNLLQAVGSEPVSAPEVELWASEVGGEAGADHLQQMLALGAIETASTVGDVQHLKFNPLTARLLL